MLVNKHEMPGKSRRITREHQEEIFLNLMLLFPDGRKN